MQILGLAGSLRRGSHSRGLLRAAAQLLPEGHRLVCWEGVELLPAYNEDLEDHLPVAVAVEHLRRQVAGSDGLLIATPEYNGSVPGALKNALDWASRPWPDNCLRDKPALVIGVSSGLFGAVWAQAELRKILTTSGAAVLEHEVPFGLVDGPDFETHEQWPRLGDGLRQFLDVSADVSRSSAPAAP
jgi:chromate reductase